MNLIYIIPSLDKVGPINVVLDLVKGFSKRGYNIKILSFKDGFLKSEFSKYSDVIIERNIFNIFNILKTETETIVHSHGFFPDFVNSLSTIISSHNKSFSTIHNFIKLDYCFLKGNFKGSIFTIIHKMILKNIQYPINCSKSAMTFNKVGSYFIYNGVGNKYINIDSCDDFINLVYLGCFNKRKNIDVILNAVIKTTNKKIKLYVIGDGNDFEEYKYKYESDKIIFTGKLSEPFYIVNKCDYVISSSLAEGFPLAILESLSAGLSYILSDIPPHQEIYKLTGGIGYVINNNSNSFQKCLDSIIKNDKKSVIREMYKDNFSLENMIVEYSFHYEKE